MAGESGVLPPAPPAGSFLSPAEVLAGQSRGKRFSTGLERFDRNLRGGLQLGRVVVATGTPGHGKTSFLTQLFLSLIGQGFAGFGLFADEGRFEAASRMGQMLGLDRDKLETADEKTLAELRSHCEGFPFWLPDPDDPDCSIEYEASELARRVPNGPYVWLIDSIQVVQGRTAESASDERLQIKDRMTWLRKAARAHGAIALVVSQPQRGWYASPAKGRSNPLAAGAGSGQIESMADVHFVLDRDETSDLVVMRCRKNRLGPPPRFDAAFRFDTTSATYTEVDEAEVPERVDARVEAAKARILEELARSPGTNGRSLYRVIKGNRPAFERALRGLALAKLIVADVGSKGARLWRLAETSDDVDPSPAAPTTEGGSR